MKALILAAAFALTAAPVMAEPVDLVCSGTFDWYGQDYGSAPLSGVHVVVHEQVVEVSGFKAYTGLYSIDRTKGDDAVIVFNSGLWNGSINRFDGQLTLYKCSDMQCGRWQHSASATCTKAEPLF